MRVMGTIDWLGASVPLESLVEAIAATGEDIVLAARPITAREWWADPRDATVIGVRTESGSYIMDPELVMTTDAAIVVAVSEALDAPVVALGEQSTSGNLWFIAARDGRLLRNYWYDDGKITDSGEEATSAYWDLESMLAAARAQGIELDYLTSEDTVIWPILRTSTDMHTDEGPDGRPPDDGQWYRRDQAYLEFVAAGSSKGYGLVLLQRADLAWAVGFTFGRIGALRDWALKVEGVDYESARELFDKVHDEKMRSGYVAASWPEDLDAGFPTFEASREPDATYEGIGVLAAIRRLFARRVR